MAMDLTPRQQGARTYSRRHTADKRVAALLFVTMSEKPDADKVASLVASYGFSPSEASAFVREAKDRNNAHGVEI